MARPIMVAVGGDSGTGKVTLCEGLRAIFGDKRCVEIRLDGYLALNRHQRNLVGMTALDPRVHDFAAMEEDLWRLAHGESITKPVYDHRLGAVSHTETIDAQDIVLVQGLFPLYTRALRSLFDVSVWLEPQPDLKVEWQIQRDTAERGYREEQVRAEIARRRDDAERYLAPQAAYADLRASFHDTGVTILKSGRLAPLDYQEFSSDATRLRFVDDTASSYPRTILDIDASISDTTAEALETAIWDRIGRRHATVRPERLGVYRDDDGEHVSHVLALTQLLVARRIGLVADQLSDAISV